MIGLYLKTAGVGVGVVISLSLPSMTLIGKIVGFPVGVIVGTSVTVGIPVITMVGVVADGVLDGSIFTVGEGTNAEGLLMSFFAFAPA